MLKDTLIPKIITRFPKKNAFGVQSPEIFYSEPQYAHQFIVNGQHVLTLSNTDIQLKHANSDEICLEIYSDFENVNFDVVLKLHENGKFEPYSFSLSEHRKVVVKQRTKEYELDNFFYYEIHPLSGFATDRTLKEINTLNYHKNMTPIAKTRSMINGSTGIKRILRQSSEA